MYRFTILLLISLLFYCPVTNAQQVNFQGLNFSFTRPIDMAVANDGTNRFFIVEQAGRIKIYENGSVLSGNFLDLVSQVNDNGNERGLLGLAFHPDYTTNGYFYVNYNLSNGDTRIARFTVDPNDPNSAVLGSQLEIMTIDQPFSNHNGGCLRFGPDGYLYIGMGDGGSADDPLAAGQDLNTKLAKMLRIDVDGGSPYSVPADNPFVGAAGVDPDIWSYGLRNPWKFEFDRITGDLWIADVGQNNLEEIDFQPASSTGGENYGWRCYEGTDAYITGGCDLSGTFEEPVFEYPHSFSTGGFSVTGGLVYRGCEYPALDGLYFFADYVTGNIWVTNSSTFSTNQLSISEEDISSFGQDENGELYYLTLGGELGRITETSGATWTLPTVSLSGANQLESSAANSYQWYLDGNILSGETSQTVSTAASGDYTVEITNQNGCAISSEPFTVTVGIEATELLMNLNIHPNPFENQLSIQFNLKDSQSILISLVDIHGKTIQDQLFENDNSVSTAFDVDSLSPGIYFLEIQTNESKVSKKLVKR